MALTPSIPDRQPTQVQLVNDRGSVPYTITAVHVGCRRWHVSFVLAKQYQAEGVVATYPLMQFRTAANVKYRAVQVSIVQQLLAKAIDGS